MPRTADNLSPLRRRRFWARPTLAFALIAATLTAATAADWWPLGKRETKPVQQVQYAEPLPPPTANTTANTTPAFTPYADPSLSELGLAAQPVGMQVGYVGGPSPAAPHQIKGIDCVKGCCSEAGWGAARPLDFQPFAQGEYVGHARLPHVNEYRLRVDDMLEFVFRLTREETTRPYLLNVGDEVRVESFTDNSLNRDLLIQPDGTITLRLIGQMRATKRTVVQLRDELEAAYTKYYKIPAITVTPLKVNTKLEDLRATVDARAGAGGQNRQARVTPEGTIALPAIGSVPVQGLTLGELKRELDERFAAEVEGIEVTPVLLARAPRYTYVLGEVKTPGRYTLEGPTTVMQAMAMAGGWNVGANTRQIVVFRRGDDWRLLATMLDLRGALYGKMPCPADEIWVNDSDVIVVPKSPILVADDIINLVFTRGIYGVVPFNVGTSFSFLNTSSVSP